MHRSDSMERVLYISTRSDNDWSEVCAKVELGWLDANDVQVCSINAQVRPGEGVRCAWRGSRTNRSVTVPPPPGRRVPRRNSNTREGGWAPWRLEIGRDLREASRAGQGTPGAMAGLEAREAMADPGLREAMAEQETREAMADPGLREAMAGLEAREAMTYFFWVAMAGQEAPWPWS